MQYKFQCNTLWVNFEQMYEYPKWIIFLAWYVDRAVLLDVAYKQIELSCVINFIVYIHTLHAVSDNQYKSLIA